MPKKHERILGVTDGRNASINFLKQRQDNSQKIANLRIAKTCS
jgi:hypothetical protein